MPKSSRPPETMSTVVAILASTAGGRKRLLVTSSPSAQPFGLRGEGGEQRPAFEDWPIRIAADGHEVVEQPGVLDLRDRVGLPPDAKDVVVGDL